MDRLFLSYKALKTLRVLVEAVEILKIRLNGHVNKDWPIFFLFSSGENDFSGSYELSYSLTLV